MDNRSQHILIFVAVLLPFLVTAAATFKAVPPDAWVEVDEGVKGGAKDPAPIPSDADVTGDKRWESISGVDKGKAGSILIKAVYVGDPIGKTVIDLSSQPECAKVYGDKPAFSDDKLVNGKAVPWVLARVTKGLPRNVSFTTPPPRLLDQIGCAYRPHVLGLLKGQKVYIRNGDRTTHNVNLQATGADASASFNKSQAIGAKEFDVSFNATGKHETTCQIHSWMNAQILVLDNPYFVTTNDKGEGVIKMLPPGTYTLSVWHQYFKGENKTVTVEPGKQSTITFEVK